MALLQRGKLKSPKKALYIDFSVFFYLTFHIFLFIFFYMNFKKILYFLIFGCLLSTLLFAGERGKLEVTFFDLNSGNGALLVTPDGYTILIDAGDGIKSIYPYIKRKKIKRIDAIVITSPDVDNVKGIFPLIEKNIDIGEFFAPQIDLTTTSYDSLLETIMLKQDSLSSSGGIKEISDAINNKKHYEFVNIAAGTIFSWGSSLSAVVLGPYKKYRNTSSDIHNNSLVIKVTYGKQSFLFPGNVESKSERDLTKLGSKLRSTVLLIPNHGAGSSISDVFFQKVGPQYAILQPNFEAPANPILSALKNINAKVYNTKEVGIIQFKTDGLNMDIQFIK